jgi:hypothetical protein
MKPSSNEVQLLTNQPFTGSGYKDLSPHWPFIPTNMQRNTNTLPQNYLFITHKTLAINKMQNVIGP